MLIQLHYIISALAHDDRDMQIVAAFSSANFQKNVHAVVIQRQMNLILDLLLLYTYILWGDSFFSNHHYKGMKYKGKTHLLWAFPKTIQAVAVFKGFHLTHVKTEFHFFCGCMTYNVCVMCNGYTKNGFCPIFETTDLKCILVWPEIHINIREISNKLCKMFILNSCDAITSLLSYSFRSPQPALSLSLLF